MYQYEYEKIKVNTSSENSSSEEYKKVIEIRALDGWRLIQILPVDPQINNGCSHEIIFERKLQAL